MSDAELPMMATGKIVEDYRPLMTYLRLLTEEERAKVLPKTSDLNYVKDLVESRSWSLGELLANLSEILQNRVDPRVAREAIKEALNLDLGEELARKHLARILAGWVLEIAENLGIIKLRSR